MRDVYPELAQRRSTSSTPTRAEEERFLATIEGGMQRFDQLAPAQLDAGLDRRFAARSAASDAFRLYDTFGFPIDLTELMARERGYTVDIVGFEAALAGAARAVAGGAEADASSASARRRARRSSRAWEQRRRRRRCVDELRRLRHHRDRHGGRRRSSAARRSACAVLLRETPFYAESGGQISDRRRDRRAMDGAST